MSCASIIEGPFPAIIDLHGGGFFYAYNVISTGNVMCNTGWNYRKNIEKRLKKRYKLYMM